MKIWFIQVVEWLEGVLPKVVAFIGVLVKFAVILLIAYVAGRFFAWLVGSVLRKLGFEQLIKRSEAEKIAHRFGMTLIGLIEVVIRWTIYLMGLLIALKTAGLGIIDELLQRTVNYMPNLILALIIFVLGILVAEKLGNFVQGLAEDERVPRFWILGNLARYTIYLVAGIMALSHLKISTGVLMIVTGSIFATIGLLLVIGMRDMAPNVVAGVYLLYEKSLTVGDTIQMGEYEGIIEDIGIVKSVIKRGDDQYVVVPNAELMKRIITKK